MRMGRGAVPGRSDIVVKQAAGAVALAAGYSGADPMLDKVPFFVILGVVSGSCGGGPVPEVAQADRWMMRR
jgi:hypothetical protein